MDPEESTGDGVILATFVLSRGSTVSLSILLTIGVFASTASSAEDSPQFNRDIRPILSRACMSCHGPDHRTRQGGLRLDVRKNALVSADSGRHPIVPNDSGKSELIRRITADDASIRMPPPDSMKRLTSREILILQRWIDAGAVYEEHWAFKPVRRPQVPRVSRTSWTRNPIDRFILSRMEPSGVMPSPEANRETLLRRVTLDLTGLPPTLNELDSFLGDRFPGAYERVVNRLLANPAYGERQAQDWLDLARYADSRGFADDRQRAIWPYRDWVIEAINRDMPFDQFTIEQLAGDLLPDPAPQQMLATAFHRNAPQAKGNTYAVEEYRIRGVVDRVNTTGRTWLGLTLGCAECHDHKFDPVSQRDYYRIFALFNNIEHGGSGFKQGGPTMPHELVDVARRMDLTAARDRLRKTLRTARMNQSPRRLQLDDDSLLGRWDAGSVEEDPGRFALTGDFAIVATIRTESEVADIVSKYDWRGRQRSYVFGIGGEGEQNSIPGHLYAWISARTHPFDGIEIYGSQKVNDGREHRVAMTFSGGKSVRLFVDGIEDLSARVIGKPPRAIAKSSRRLAVGAGYSNSTETNAFRFEGMLRDVRIYNRVIQHHGSETEDSRIARLLTAVEEIENRLKSTSAETLSVPVMRERAEPRETFIHVRGNFLERGEKVSPGVPEFLLPDGGRPPGNRLEFARWLVSEENPLVARVVVNRLWQGHFGRGIVATSEDFGNQGSPPSHPELLDWLAREFIRRGWSMKQMHRLIVLSSTYRQDSRIQIELHERDPGNRLYARMPRTRLAAEQIRDVALSVSGLLASRLGGPPVFPQQPADYWQQRALPGKWNNSKDEAKHRRTIYTYWRRMALHPSLELLDAPARETCVARREISNVPTQALVLLNDPNFVEAASFLAERVLREAGRDHDTRLDHGFRLVLSRLPDAAERARFLDFISGEEMGTDDDLTVWTRVSGILLNLDETVTRQ